MSSAPETLSRLLSQLSVRRISAVYLWLGFMVLFGILAPNTFLTETTFLVVFGEGVITCLLALAFLIPLAAGIYDLSIGGVMALSLALSVYLSIHTGLPPGVGALVAVAACTLTGFVSGFIVVRLRVNSFIGTLGVSQVLLAICLLLSGNKQIVGEFPESWSTLGNGKILGIPNVDFFLLAVALVLWYVLEHTRIGRYVFATGGNPEAARLAGVKTDRLIWGTLVASATMAGLAGVVYSMRAGIFTATTGPGYLFPAVAAVFLGASQLSQRPNVWGTLIAYFALAFGVQGLLLAVSSAAVWSQPLFQGVALIVAVALAAKPVSKKLKQQKAETDRMTRPHTVSEAVAAKGEGGG
ncbi:MAG TPA: ABC transporter permease [Solirubrobacterales bacterium]|nr:ABC transporter permease [Solirubrobacterales bacterium]